jgi:preprotein translocase subunit SecA
LAIYSAPTVTGEVETLVDETTVRGHQGRAAAGAAGAAVASMPRVGRNDPCPCGSGKKYKQCHGKLA